MNAKAEEGRSDILSTGRVIEAAAVAAVTAGGYGVAFAYEAGYARAFEIPAYLIRVDLIAVLSSLAAMAGAGVMLFLAANFLVMLSSKMQRPSSRRLLFRVAPLVVFLWVIIAWYGKYWREWVVLAVVIAGLGLLLFLFPLAFGDKASTCRSRVEAADAADAAVPDLLQVLLKRLGPVPLLIMLYVPLILLLAWHIGKAEAMRENRFLVTAQGPAQEVVLRNYGDRLVLGTLDSTGTRLTDEFRIANANDLSSVRMKWRVIGEMSRASSRRAQR